MNKRRRFKAKRRRLVLAQTQKNEQLNCAHAKRFLAERARVQRIAQTPLKPPVLMKRSRLGPPVKVTPVVQRPFLDPDRALRQLERKTPKVKKHADPY